MADEIVSIEDKQDIFIEFEQAELEGRKCYVGINVNIDKIKSHPYNPNEMDKKMFDLLADNISRNGFVDPILCRAIPEGYQIINGEHRYLALKNMNATHVPTIFVIEMSDAQSMVELIMQNKVSGSFRPDKLSEALKFLSTKLQNMQDLTGWSKTQLLAFTELEGNKNFIPLTKENISEIRETVANTHNEAVSVQSEAQIQLFMVNLSMADRSELIKKLDTLNPGDRADALVKLCGGN